MILQEYDITNCVNRTLDSFGPGLKYRIFWKIDEINGSNKNRRKSWSLLSNPDALVVALQKVLGKAGREVELRIVEDIKRVAGGVRYSKIEGFVELVKRVREDQLQAIPTLVSAMSELYPY